MLWVAALPAAAALQFPELTGRVVDRAAMLSSATEARLTEMLSEHERATSNQVVVVTLPDLQGTTIEDFGYQLGRAWGIGQEGRDNGVLLLVAPNERKVRIEVGYGLEGTLTDALSHNIIQTVILPRFRQGEMEAGVEAGAEAITQALAGTYEPLPEPEREQREGRAGGFLFLVLFALMAGEAVAGRLRNRALSGGIVGGGTFLIGLLVLGSVALAIAIAALVLVFHLFLGPGGRGGGGRGGFYYGGGFGGGGFGGGGGFSGGGGSFGGGGASGGW